MTYDFAISGVLTAAALLAIAGASVSSRPDRLRLALIVAGLAMTVEAIFAGRGWLIPVAAFAVAAINALALLRVTTGAPLDADAALFARRHVPDLQPSDVALLIGQGSRISARAGDVITHEGQPVDQLTILYSGCAAAMIDGHIVGRIAPGDLIGEASLLDDPRASATVRIAEPAQLWVIERDRLRTFLKVHPRIAAALGTATVAALRDKLQNANRASVGD